MYTIKNLRGVILDAIGQSAIELEAESNGKKVKIKVTSKEELEAAVVAIQQLKIDEFKKTQRDVQKITDTIKAVMRLGNSLDEAVKLVQNATPGISEEVVLEAKQEVFATTFDDSEEIRQAIREAAKYLGYNPRKIKRFINAFRLQSLIANRRKLLEKKLIKLNILAKCVVITTRYPDVVEAMINDQSFIKNLQKVYHIKNKLINIQDQIFSFVNKDPKNQILESDKDKLYSEEENLKSTLNISLNDDPRLKRLIEARDLIHLLKDITDSNETDDLMYYLYLAQFTIDQQKTKY